MPEQVRTSPRTGAVVTAVVVVLALVALVVGVTSLQSRDSTPAVAESPTPEATAREAGDASTPAGEVASAGAAGTAADTTGGATGQAEAGPQGEDARTATVDTSLVPVVTAGEVAANPTVYYGRNVSVQAEIEEVLTARSFTLDEDRIGASPDLLVLLPEPAGALPPAEGAMVMVVGRVEPFVESRLTRLFDWFKPAPDVLVRLRARPVVIATSVQTFTGMTIVPNEGPTPVLVTNPGRIGDNPGPFYGHRVLLPDATIDDVRSARAFTLDDPAFLLDTDLLVILPSIVPGAAVRDGLTVTVRGTVRRYVSGQFDRDYDWYEARDFDDLSGWRDRPVVVADLVRPEGGGDTVLLDVDWESPTTIGGQDWWLARTWEPLPTGPTETEPEVSETPPAISDLAAILDADNRAALVGRDVDLSDIGVQQVIGESLMLVGTDAGHVVAVRVQPDHPDVEASTRIDLSGTVRRVPESLDGWQLDETERDSLQSRQLFIDADRLEVAADR